MITVIARPRREIHCHVLHRVNGQVGLVIQQRLFQFLDKHAFTAHFRQRFVQKSIGYRLYGLYPDAQAGMHFL